MFTSKTTILSGGMSEKLSNSVGNLMDKGSEMLDAGMKVMNEAFKESNNSEGVSATIRIRLTPQQVIDLQSGKTLTFKTDGTTIRLEKEKV